MGSVCYTYPLLCFISLIFLRSRTHHNPLPLVCLQEVQSQQANPETCLRPFYSHIHEPRSQFEYISSFGQDNPTPPCSHESKRTYIWCLARHSELYPIPFHSGYPRWIIYSVNISILKDLNAHLRFFPSAPSQCSPFPCFCSWTGSHKASVV